MFVLFKERGPRSFWVSKPSVKRRLSRKSRMRDSLNEEETKARGSCQTSVKIQSRGNNWKFPFSKHRNLIKQCLTRILRPVKIHKPIPKHAQNGKASWMPDSGSDSGRSSGLIGCISFAQLLKVSGTRGKRVKSWPISPFARISRGFDAARLAVIRSLALLNLNLEEDGHQNKTWMVESKCFVHVADTDRSKVVKVEAWGGQVSTCLARRIFLRYSRLHFTAPCILDSFTPAVSVQG